MKKKIILLLFIPLLCAMTCDDDPCDDNVSYIINYDLVTVDESQTSFTVGDTLWLDAIVSRNQNLQNSSQSSYDLFTKNETLAYYLNMYKNSNLGSDYQVSIDTENLISVKGNVANNYFTLTKEGDNFVNRTGIKLTESGSFRINVNDISSYGTGGCNVATQIQTRILNSGLEGYFNFNVE